MVKLFVCNGKATMIFEVERRTETKDYPGFPAHRTDYLYVDGVKVAMVYEAKGAEHITCLDHYAMLPAGPAREVGRALHLQCAPRLPGSRASWLG